MTGKRERILEGMLEAVGAKGYEQTTVQDAIEAAGLYRQAFYDSFSDKEDCYLQALEAGVVWAESVMREAAAAGEPNWRGRMRGSLRGLLEFLDNRPRIGRALLVEVHAAGPRAVEKRTEAMVRAAKLIDLARAEGDGAAPAISAEAVVAGRATSTFTGLCRNWPVMRWISGGMVAVKNNVWRVNGTSLQMRSMSGMKPMSSMRSASSRTSSSTPVSNSRPRSK